eukprot:364114-Chlamydomonas_euryale.AAC.6
MPAQQLELPHTRHTPALPSPNPLSPHFRGRAASHLPPWAAQTSRGSCAHWPDGSGAQSRAPRGPAGGRACAHAELRVGAGGRHACMHACRRAWGQVAGMQRCCALTKVVGMQAHMHTCTHAHMHTCKHACPRRWDRDKARRHTAAKQLCGAGRAWTAAPRQDVPRSGKPRAINDHRVSPNVPNITYTKYNIYHQIP